MAKTSNDNKAINWKVWVAFAVQLVFNLLIWFYWGGGINERIKNNTKVVTKNEVKIDHHLSYHIELSGLVHEINANVINIKANVEKLDIKYEKLLEIQLR